MADLSISGQWTFTSSGVGKAIQGTGHDVAYAWQIETSSGCTAVVQIQTRMGSSGGDDSSGYGHPYNAIATVVCTVSDVQTAQFLGPLGWMKPRVTDKTAGATNVITIRLMGN